MTPAAQRSKTVVDRIESITKRASAAGLTLDLHAEGKEWHWKWSNGISGFTNASKQVALAFACEDVEPWLP